MFRTTVNGAAKRDWFCASQDSLKRMMDAFRSLGFFLKACVATANPAVAVVCCLLLSVVGGCGGGSFVRFFVCSFVHVFVCGGYCVLCRCVVLCRLVSSSLSLVLSSLLCVVCRCVLSVRVRGEILGLVEKTNYREGILPLMFSLFNNGGDQR